MSGAAPERALSAIDTEAHVQAAPKRAPKLAYLPVGLFGSVMGLTGLSIAWHLAALRYGAPVWIGGIIGAVAIIVFVALIAGYLTKIVTAPHAVAAEFRHPIAGNLFGTVFISLLLTPILIAPHALKLAQVIWSAGAVGMVTFAWIIVSRWMSERQHVDHAVPAWIIPVVGMLDLPLALPTLGLPPMHGLMVLGLAVGLFFAVPVFTFVLSRLVFEDPMPEALQPTLLLLIAPFAVGYSSYVVTSGQTDLFAQSLYVLTLFILAVLLGRLRRAAMRGPFKVAWWATSFPLAASAIAALRFAAASPGAVTDAIALMLLAFATLVIGVLLVQTLLGVATGRLRAMST
jgi:tellurite resistance protein